MCSRNSRRNYKRIVCLGLSLIGATCFYFFIFHILFNDSKYWRSARSSELFNRISAFKNGIYNFNLDNSIRSLQTQKGQACVHPHLELWDKSIIRFFESVPELQCSHRKNWVYVENNTFRILPEAIKKHGGVTCNYIPQVRGGNDFAVINGNPIVNMKDRSPLPTDFFKASCVASDGQKYENLHSGVSRKAKVIAKIKDAYLSQKSMGMNVLMFGFDSVSRMTWMRNLPKSHSYFTNELGGYVLNGYNIVGDGTPQALLPILTGKTEAELPEARRGKPGSATVDGHPWIWKDFKKAGYVTQYGEDGAAFGTFQYRMLGFKNQPVDHYMRPFYLLAEKLYYLNMKYCLGSMPRHLNMMNWWKDLVYAYPTERKFSFVFHSEFSHEHTSQLQMADNDLKSILKELHTGGGLNNTILILMADHGARFQSLRQTVQGKIEERMPYMAFRFPTWFGKKYPTALQNFKINVHRLTTPFDIHATFHDILEYSGDKMGKVEDRGISLFKEIPKSRTCKNAGVEAHWCACVNWKKADHNQPDVISAVQELVKRINLITSTHRDQCEVISTSNISSAVKFEPNHDVLKFKQSSDFDGRKADMSDNMQVSEILYQVTVRTQPGNGLFEATIKYNVKDKKYVANDREISRINKYGKQPHCVMEQHPHLRPFCYCKVQL